MKHAVFFLIITLFTTGYSIKACAADTTAHTYLALGDSYTIGTSVAAKDRYPAQALNMLKSDGYVFRDENIIAASGWTTNDLLQALQHTKTTARYDIVTLLIGVNNQYQQGNVEDYRKEFTMLLKKSIELAGNNPAHVIVISIPDYTVTPFARELDRNNIAREIDLFNRINAETASEYHTGYLNITEESRKAGSNNTLIARDGLHFSGEEYGIWAFGLKTIIEKALSR